MFWRGVRQGDRSFAVALDDLDLGIGWQVLVERLQRGAHHLLELGNKVFGVKRLAQRFVGDRTLHVKILGQIIIWGHSSLNTTRIYVQPTAEQLVERLNLNAYVG